MNANSTKLHSFSDKALRKMLHLLEEMARAIKRADKKVNKGYPISGICGILNSMSFSFMVTGGGTPLIDQLFKTWTGRDQLIENYPVPPPSGAILTSSSFFYAAMERGFLWWAPANQPMYREYANSRRTLLRHCIYQLRLELHARKNRK